MIFAFICPKKRQNIHRVINDIPKTGQKASRGAIPGRKEKSMRELDNSGIPSHYWEPQPETEEEKEKAIRVFFEKNPQYRTTEVELPFE